MMQRPVEPERAARWDETLSEIRSIENQIDAILATPGYGSCQAARENLADLEQKREYRINRLQII